MEKWRLPCPHLASWNFMEVQCPRWELPRQVPHYLAVVMLVNGENRNSRAGWMTFSIMDESCGSVWMIILSSCLSSLQDSSVNLSIFKPLVRKTLQHWWGCPYCPMPGLTLGDPSYLNHIVPCKISLATRPFQRQLIISNIVLGYASYLCQTM